MSEFVFLYRGGVMLQTPGGEARARSPQEIQAQLRKMARLDAELGARRGT